jgi:hypothetical protein
MRVCVFSSPRALDSADNVYVMIQYCTTYTCFHRLFVCSFCNYVQNMTTTNWPFMALSPIDRPRAVQTCVMLIAL